MNRAVLLFACALIGGAAIAQTKAPLPPLPAPQAVPKPATDTGQPYAPQSILPGGIVVPLFPSNSPYLKADKIHMPEVCKMSQDRPWPHQQHCLDPQSLDRSAHGGKGH